MQFPILRISRDEYRHKILRQLTNNNCIIFFDTNLFSQLFKLYSGARKEFYTWFNSDPIKDRVKIANWSMQEYNNRAITEKLDGYLDGVLILKTLGKNLNDTGNFLQMFYDEEVKGNEYNSREEFIKDVQTVKDTFGKISRSVKIEKNTIEKLNEELRQYVSQAVIISNIFDLTSNIQQEAEFRHLNNIPPGFKDDGKGTNKYGDLIIWKEMLAYCKKNEIKDLIFVSNDGKRDLIYHPFVPTINGGKRKLDDVRLPDPRLIEEFRTHTDSEEFSIIGFATLISLLQEVDRASFAELSSAIQIAMSSEMHHQPNAASMFDTPTDIEVDFNETLKEQLASGDTFKPGPNIVSLDTVENTAEGERQSIRAIQQLAIPTYSFTALSDAEFSDEEIGELSGIATSLASQNWYHQNDAIIKLRDLEKVQITNENILFVIGRRIYSAACGNSFEAINYIQTFEVLAESRDRFQTEHILNGMVYEIYFNHKNEFRKNRFKAGFIDVLFSIAKNKQFDASTQFIHKALEPFAMHIFVLPGEGKTINVFLQLTDGDSYPVAKEFVINDIIIEQKSIVQDKDPQHDPFFPQYGFDSDFRRIDEGKLLLILSYNIAVPASQLKLSESPNLNGKEIAVYTMKEDKTISLP